MSSAPNAPLITIEIPSEFDHTVTPATIRDAVLATLLHKSIPQDISLTVVITGDPQIRELNHQYRDMDAPTDVLSFPADYPDPESGTTYLGDVILSYPQAAVQAEEHGVPILDEIQLLVVHGTLHLLDYDHRTPDEKKRMWTVQNAILDRLEISTNIV